MTLETITADYLVVGAGSAGCVVAGRLAEAGHGTLLLEAGPRDSNFWIHLPAGGIKLFNHPVLNWNFLTEPEEGLDERQIYTPRGRVVGGSGSINGMNFVRGNREDFDRWEQAGATGWGYDSVLPYFKKLETRKAGDPRFRGTAGPIPVEDYRFKLPINRIFVEAAKQAGHSFVSDINGEQAEGVGYSQMNRTWRRMSSARAYLPLGGERLRVETNASVERLVFEGRRCVGAIYRKRGVRHLVRVRKEVALCAGAIGSPQLLQISGIGDPDHLRSIGVETVHALPSVGRQLTDHFQSTLVQRIQGLMTSNHYASGVRMIREFFRWVLTGGGAMTFGGTQVSVFCRTKPELTAPDLQLLFAPLSFNPTKFGDLERQGGMTVSICAGRPQSRGSVMARSNDIAVPPSIRVNYLAHEADRTALIKGFEIARSIFAAPAFDTYRAEELRPGKDVVAPEDLLAYARATGGSVYHPAGTCAMGAPEAAVVDPSLRVNGIDALRVIDASVMPSLTTGNTNAPTMMIGEKGVAMILNES